MESRVKFFGHPIHPVLVVYPLGMLSAAVIFDIIYLITNDTAFTTVSYYMIAVGVIGGLVAAIFGLVDWLAIPKNSRAKRIGGWHGIGNAVIVVLFAVSWLMRNRAVDFVPNTLALVLSFAGIGLALITGWIGGELVYRLSVGVDPGANVDAPSSLSDQPASATKSKRTSAHASD